MGAALNFDVRTRRGLLQRVAVVTAISVLVSIVTSAIAFVWLFGFDLDRTFSVADALRFVCIASVVVPAIVAPLASYRAGMLMHQAMIARDAYEKLSRIDELTGLRNRRGFDDDAVRLLSDSDMPHGAVLMADIDRFKLINDRMGHDFGDAALRHVAEMFRTETTGWPSVVGRQGGDEFVVAVVGVTVDEALAIAESIKQACAERTIRCNGKTGVVTVSIGVAISSDRGEPLTRLVSRADDALLTAKREGRDRVVAQANAAA
jgi:diguanylate cyclase (GGDEF)-like protein